MGKSVQNLTQYGESLINDTKLVDSFTRDTGSVASLYAPIGSDWIVVSSSLKDPSGKRNLGAKLTPEHPGYKAISNGEEYYNNVTLFGKRYITYYAPIKSSDRENYCNHLCRLTDRESDSRLIRLSWQHQVGRYRIHNRCRQ